MYVFTLRQRSLYPSTSNSDAPLVPAAFYCFVRSEFLGLMSALVSNRLSDQCSARGGISASKGGSVPDPWCCCWNLFTWRPEGCCSLIGHLFFGLLVALLEELPMHISFSWASCCICKGTFPLPLSCLSVALLLPPHCCCFPV